MQPKIFSIFGFGGDDLLPGEENEEVTPERPEKKSDGGLGYSLGNFKLESGTIIDACQISVRDQWNMALHGRLQAIFEGDIQAKVPDLRFRKNRLSGLWEPPGKLDKFLKENGTKNLLFADVNSDQCVLAMIKDASLKWYYTVLLRDGCGTNGSKYARQYG